MKRNPYQKDRKTNNSNGFLFRKSNPRSLYQCQNKKNYNRRLTYEKKATSPYHSVL